MDLEAEGPPLLRRDALVHAEEVLGALVHAHEAYGAEVVVEAAEVALGVGKEARVEEAGHDLALDLEGLGGEVHEVVEARVELAARA